MVVRYIKVTFVTIFVLVVGLISTVNIKGANGENNLDLEWFVGSDVFGSYETASIDTLDSKWDTFFYGRITNDTAPMQIDITFSNGSVQETIILEPNIYTIYHEPGDSGARLVTIKVGGALPEHEVYRKEYNVQDIGYIALDFYYYTSGILKDYFDVGVSDGQNQQSHNVGQLLPNGVSDTIEFRNGKAYYVQRIKKYTLQASDISGLTTASTYLDWVSINRNNLVDISSQIAGSVSNSRIYIKDYSPGSTNIQDKIDGEYLYYDSLSVSRLLLLTFPKGTYVTLAEARADLVGTEIYYQLAEPIETLMVVETDYMDYYWSGFDTGKITGRQETYYGGFNTFINPTTGERYDVLNSFSYKHGFRDGAVSNTDFSFTGILTQIFTGVGSVLAIELLPNITLGAIVAVPIVFGIIYFILGKRSKD